MDFVVFFGFPKPTIGGFDKSGMPALFAPDEFLKFSPPKNEKQRNELILFAKQEKNQNFKGKCGPFGHLGVADGPLKNMAYKPELFDFLIKNLGGHSKFCTNCGAVFTPQSQNQKYCKRPECLRAKNTNNVRNYRKNLKKKGK